MEERRLAAVCTTLVAVMVVVVWHRHRRVRRAGAAISSKPTPRRKGERQQVCDHEERSGQQLDTQPPPAACVEAPSALEPKGASSSTWQGSGASSSPGTVMDPLSPEPPDASMTAAPLADPDEQGDDPGGRSPPPPLRISSVVDRLRRPGIRRVSLNGEEVSAAVLPELPSPPTKLDGGKKEECRPSKGAKASRPRHMTSTQLRNALRQAGVAEESLEDVPREELVSWLERHRQTQPEPPHGQHAVRVPARALSRAA